MSPCPPPPTCVTCFVLLLSTFFYTMLQFVQFPFLQPTVFLLFPKRRLHINVEVLCTN
eukprot:m.356821 g.356821  ORF g.356821 m.356821 type:complete len:58 (+) comp17633_c0_seq1:1436-1609(+)